jgi:ribosomal protein S18 acetylase RimI-like enzyme
LKVEDLSLGWRSHLLACSFGGEIVERHDCIVTRSPSNPTHYWGNCLILASAPRDNELAYWLQRFDEEIASRQPGSEHLAFGVDAALLTQPLPSWRAVGIEEFDEIAVLTQGRASFAATMPTVRDTPSLALRALVLPDEMDLLVEAQVANRDPSFEEAGYRVYRRRAMQRMASMQAAGIAHWYGALVGAELAADCGLVHDGRLGRFQHVGTQPAWRRRGLCRALVHHVCRHAFDTLGLQCLVMCADPHDVAIGIYRSVGFTQVESHWCLQRRPPRDRS